MPPPTAGGALGADSGAGAGSGAASGSGASGSGASSLPPPLPFEGFSFASSSSSNSPSFGTDAEEEVCSLFSPESSGRLDGAENSGQLPAAAASMKERQIGPAVGPPKPVS